MGYQMEILQQVNIFMESIDDLYGMLQQIMIASMEAVCAQASSVFLYDMETGELVFDVVLGAKGDKLFQRKTGLGEGIVGWAAQRREIVNITDVRVDDRFDDSWDRMTGFETRSILAVPMIRRGELVGVLEVINKEGDHGFGPDDQELLWMIASQAAIAVENAKLYEAVLERNRLLEDALTRLKETQKKLIQAEKMSTIGNMSSQIMHDIRNPMSIIRMSCEILSNPRIEDKDVREIIDVIQTQVDRSVNMIRDFLDFARGETRLDLKEHPVNRLINDIIGFQQRDCANKGIAFDVSMGYSGLITMDIDKMHRVLTNLLDNAKEAVMERKGGQQGQIGLQVLSTDGFVEFTVTDNGPGIQPDIRSKLFEPFVSRGKKNGTGLGLAIVDKIVKDHGGSITIETRYDSAAEGYETGTSIAVAIPRFS